MQIFDESGTTGTLSQMFQIVADRSAIRRFVADRSAIRRWITESYMGIEETEETADSTEED